MCFHAVCSDVNFSNEQMVLSFSGIEIYRTLEAYFWVVLKHPYRYCVYLPSPHSKHIEKLPLAA